MTLRRYIPNKLRTKVSPGQGAEEFHAPAGGHLPVGAPRPTGLQVLRSAQRFRGEPYNQGPGRTSQTSGYKDCSGLVYAALVGVGIDPGGTVSTTLETWAVRNGGRYVDRQYALSHPGVGLAIWGLGDRGHIGLSVGDGRQAFETPSAEHRTVGFSPFDRNAWEEFFTFPGVDYDHSEPTPIPEEDPFIPEDEMITVYAIRNAPAGVHGLWKKDGDVVIPILQEHANNLTASGLGRGVVIATLVMSEHQQQFDQCMESRRAGKPLGGSAGPVGAHGPDALEGFDPSQLENEVLRRALGA